MEVLIYGIATAIFFYILYKVVKAAVRDGIVEASYRLGSNAFKAFIRDAVIEAKDR